MRAPGFKLSATQHKKELWYRGPAKYRSLVFFKLILIVYLENLTSDRKIIEHSRTRLDILFILGYDIDEELPSHSTINRTRQLYGEDVFRELFQKVLSLCVQKNMISGKRQAIDSAYVKANASMDSLVEKEVVEDGLNYWNELSCDEYGNTVEQHVNVMKDDRDNNHITRSRKEYRPASWLEGKRV